MNPRVNYEMTEADFENILEACRPVPMIMLQCGGGRSQQDRANDAWAELGSRMGFDAMTVLPDERRGVRAFTAVPTDTPAQKEEREKRQAKEKRDADIERLTKEIAAKQAELDKLH